MNIPFRKFTFTLEPQEQMSMPVYKGSTVRGGFGTVFRRIVCALKRKDCGDCMLRSSCVYSYVFETSPQKDAAVMHMGTYEKIPHPFIIEPPPESRRQYGPGESFSFALVLVGRALDYLPYFIYTFEELGKVGLGRGRGKYSLQTVESNGIPVYLSADRTVRRVDPEILVVPDAPEFGRAGIREITLRFLTPTRISYQRVLTHTLEFHVLIRNLLRRVGLLRYFHCEKVLPQWDHRAIIAQAGSVEIVRNHLQWHDWERYSTRQSAKLKMGGITGEITYRGEIGPFLPMIKAGEILHVGKGTTFGLGKYETVRE
jgi:CRISPR-associated endoribonuclease Cas6